MLRTVAARSELIIRTALGKPSIGTFRLLSTQFNRSLHVLRFTHRKILAKSHIPKTCQNFVRVYSDYPKHIKVALPALSPTMEQGTIVSWEKKEGDKLNEGDLLAEIETDKATMGFETPEEGYLAKIIVPAGTKDVAIGKLVCIIVENEADIAAFKDFKDDGKAVSKVAVKPAALPTAEGTVSEPSPQPSEVQKPMVPVEQQGARVYASPMAKKLAEAQQMRLEGRGSGVYGSIKSTDLAGMSAGASAAVGKETIGGGTRITTGQGGYIDIPVSNIRAVIAKRLKESKQQIPHYYVSVECQVDNLLKMRQLVNKKYEKQAKKVSVNDFIIKATASACRKVPESNSYWMDTVIRQFDSVDVSVAVSTDRGLITPIIFSADRKGVIEISDEIKSLAQKARDNKLKPHEFQGGTISVSNLGMFGVTNFAAVINPPQSCILAIGTTSKKLILDADNIKGFKEINVMNVTLSADHRTVDGAVAAKWLQYFRDFVEDPQTMIL